MRPGIPELPLLRRELTELANRRRTYIVRVGGAVVLLAFVFLAYVKAIDEREQLMGIYGSMGMYRHLGIGAGVFAEIAPILFYTIQLLLPALCCAALTSEKENNTIGTLLLTKLTPGTIILEKAGSRVVPMLTILLIAFPVLALVHSLGGVDTALLLGTIWLLLSECFLIAAVAILCSSWCSTTTSAFIWSYVAIGFMLMLSLSLQISTIMPSAIWRDFFFYGSANISGAQLAFMRTFGLLPGTGAGGPETLSVIFIRTIPSWTATSALLLTARFFVVRRAFVSQASALLKIFRVVDRFFREINKVTGGIEVIRDSNPLPGDDPVAWRERNKKSLGKARYLFRILVLLEVPTLFVCLIAATFSAQTDFVGLYVLECLIWVLAALIAAVKGATLFSSERAKETIEPLLASPMTASELLTQKVAGMRRLLIVLSIPMLTVTLTHFLLNMNAQQVSMRPYWYLFVSCSGIGVALYLVALVSTGVGLKIHSQSKSVLISVTIITTWVIVPLVAASTLSAETPLRELIITFSPFSLLESSERYLTGRELFGPRWIYSNDTAKYWWTATHSLYAILTGLIWLTLRATAPGLLNRRESPAKTPSPITVSSVPLLEGSK